MPRHETREILKDVSVHAEKLKSWFRENYMYLVQAQENVSNFFRKEALTGSGAFFSVFTGCRLHFTLVLKG